MHNGTDFAPLEKYLGRVAAEAPKTAGRTHHIKGTLKQFWSHYGQVPVAELGAAFRALGDEPAKKDDDVRVIGRRQTCADIAAWMGDAYHLDLDQPAPITAATVAAWKGVATTASSTPDDPRLAAIADTHTREAAYLTKQKAK